jgi:LDH2 family malate/lactate/ureidoglycolate dehydrogenase
MCEPVTDPVRIDPSALRDFYRAALLASGLTIDSAETTANGVLFADLHGIDSHGALHFARLYLDPLRNGRVDAHATPALIREAGACALIDGHNAVGFVAGRLAMETAIRLAGRFGAGAVAVRNSSHAGCMGFYTRQAAASGMIGLAFTNLGEQAMLVPPGGAEPLVGTNVIAAAAPSRCQPPFALDMSVAAVSAGRVRLAAHRGQRVPPGWLRDCDGTSVTDPREFDRGIAFLELLGAGAGTAYKGFGLALLIEILCGTLGGAGMGPLGTHEWRGGGQPRGNIGHFFLALDVAAFGARESFRTDCDRMLAVVSASRPRLPDGRVCYPGLLEAEISAHRSRHGIPFDRNLLDQLAAIAVALRLEPPPTLDRPLP